jgi:ribosome-binding factor A
MKRDEEAPVKGGEGAGHRHLRVQGLVLEELRALLRDDVHDPALEAVGVAAVVLSVDYRHARVHFVVRGRGELEAPPVRAIERALERATPFLRARLADAIEMKRVPDLRFVFDGVATAGEGEGEGGKGGGSCTE